MSNDRVIRLKKLKILDEIREIYHENTGMIISFHYHGGEYRFDFYPLYERSKFCKLIQSTKEGLKLCEASDIKGLNTAKKKKGFAIYRCHAGLVDVAIPLFYKGIEFDSIYTGQILLDEPTEENFNKVYKGIKYLDIDYNLLKDAYFKVKVIDKEKLHFYVKLLSLIGNYIIKVENEIFLQKEVIKQNRRLHEKENEKIRLEKALKDLSISVLEFEKNSKKKQKVIENEDIKNSYIITNAQLFIKENCNKNIRLADVAGAVYLSPNYFSAVFRKITGYTFCNYLMLKRIENAKNLLKKTNIPIKEIVFQVGFEDYNYFNRTFKRIEGTPPAGYRKMFNNSVKLPPETL